MLSGLVLCCLHLCCLLAFAAAAPGPFGNDTEPLDNWGNQDIINGDDSKYGYFNYILLLKRNGQFICGASLISSTRALTAAHCILSGSYQVVAGELVRNQDSGYEVERNVTSIVKHPNYDNYYLKDDIAILKFSSIPNSQYIKPIPRYTDADGDPRSKLCYIAGWGQVSGNGSVSNVLKYGDMKVITNTECSGKFGSIGNYQVCAQKYSDNRGACIGDSGGPLECSDVSGTGFKLLGITSFWAKGCNTSAPTVYASVVYYESWIDSNI